MAKKNEPEAVLQGGGLRVAFYPCGDRFAHSISVTRFGEAEPLLASIEGDASQDWPASPPLQEFYVQEGPAGTQQGMLVGRAGKSHWSIAVELDPRTRKVSFDVACRIQQPPDRLGSRYEILAEQRADGQGLLLSKGGCVCRLVMEEVDDTTAVLEESPGRLAIVAPSATLQLPETIRWKYQIECLSCGEG